MSQCRFPDITTQQLAELSGLTPRQIQRLAAGRTIVKAGRNRYDLRSVVPALIRYYRQGAEGDGDLAAENLRHRIASRREIEQRVEMKARDLIPAAEVHAAITTAMTLVSSQLDGLAGRIANQVAAEGDPAVCKKVIFDETRRIRTAAAAELDALAGSYISDEGDEATEGDDGE
jgi:phage terminase Nu1 subunit (DNA packaging protein)